jgi:pyrroloquinoline quinone biosynthesis protein D
LTAPIDAQSVPELKRGVRLQYNEQRQQWVVQAPERVLMPDEIAVAVLKRCDGKATIAAIGAELAREYEAPPETVTSDIIAMLQDLAEKGIIADARA